jgi:hypothetical protein
MLVSKLVMPLCYLTCGSMLGLPLAGCVAQAGMGVRAHTVTYAEVEGPPVVFAEPPVLVAVDRDVWVVEDSDDEVFWTGGFYWVSYGGFWYHSTSYAGGWVRAETHLVPSTIVRIRPGTYVAYHRPPGAVVRRAAHATATTTIPPGHRDPPGMRRGHDRKVSPEHLGDVESRGHGNSHHKHGRR